MKIILLLITSASIFISCAYLEGHKTISKHGISIQYPSEWDIVELAGYSILVKEKALSNEYALLCNFVVELNNNFKSLNAFIKHYKVKMSNVDYLKDWKIESEKTIDFKGNEGTELVTTCSTGKFKSKSRIILIHDGTRIVNFSTTSAVSEFKKNKDITDRIFESVILNGKNKAH